MAAARVSLATDDDLVALVRALRVSESVVVLVDPGRDPLSLALTRAALAPLAIERAPMRINGVLPAADADPVDVEAAAAWLDGARSTTGQWIEISAPAAARTAPANR